MSKKLLTLLQIAVRCVGLSTNKLSLPDVISKFLLHQERKELRTRNGRVDVCLQTHSGCSYFNSSDTLPELLRRRTSSSNHETLGTSPDLILCMASHDAGFSKGHVSGSILPLQVAADYKNDIPNAGTELRRQQTTHGGVQQRKGARIAWLQSGFSLSLVRGPGLE